MRVKDLEIAGAMKVLNARNEAGSAVKRLVSCFKKLLHIEIECVIKRTEVDGVRDFYPRYIWRTSTNNATFECEWEGFAEVKDCIEDMLNQFSS